MSNPTPPWLNGLARAALALLVVSGCFSYRSTQVVDGRVVSDIDYGAAPLALVALGLFLFAAGRAVDQEDARRSQRMVLLYALAGLSALRLWAAVGFLPF